MSYYRPEIDGLRAIAIIPVVLFHAGFLGFFGGGYVGVDIFLLYQVSLLPPFCSKKWYEELSPFLTFGNEESGEFSPHFLRCFL